MRLKPSLMVIATTIVLFACALSAEAQWEKSKRFWCK